MTLGISFEQTSISWS